MYILVHINSLDLVGSLISQALALKLRRHDLREWGHCQRRHNMLLKLLMLLLLLKEMILKLKLLLLKHKLLLLLLLLMLLLLLLNMLLLSHHVLHGVKINPLISEEGLQLHVVIRWKALN